MKNEITTTLLVSLLSITSACTDSSSSNSKTGVVAQSANKESVVKENVPEKDQSDNYFTQFIYGEDSDIGQLLVTEETVDTFELPRDHFFGNPRSTSVNFFLHSNGTFELSYYYREDDLLRGIPGVPTIREKLSNHVGRYYFEEETGNLVLEGVGILIPTSHNGMPAAYLELSRTSLLRHESDNRALIVRLSSKIEHGSH